MELKAVILIVDDEPLLRTAGTAMVEDAGFEAIEGGGRGRSYSDSREP